MQLFGKEIFTKDILSFSYFDVFLPGVMGIGSAQPWRACHFYDERESGVIGLRLLAARGQERIVAVAVKHGV